MERSMITGASLVSAPMHELRDEFPVLERVGYLNAGTNGPVPARAARAAATAVELQCENGRGDTIFFEAAMKNLDELRARVARVLGCGKGELAITGATTDGINAVLAGLDLQPGDEVVTSDEEHPGVSAPLARLRERIGIELRVAAFDELAAAVRPRTRLVACSHVSWMTGRVADVAALASTDALVLLDGAQGLGAIPLDVKQLGCDFYAASGQKWLCGPNGTGYLYVAEQRATELAAPWPGYMTVAGGDEPFEPEWHGDARRFDTGFPSSEQVAWALGALDVLEEAGLERVQRRAIGLAGLLAAELVKRGKPVAPRGESTLVSFEDDDPSATVERLRERGLVTRAIPRRPYVRASVGGWSSEDEIERLVELVA
jgi:selenocysteine lyase/cysteine desulfurase